MYRFRIVVVVVVVVVVTSVFGKKGLIYAIVQSLTTPNFSRRGTGRHGQPPCTLR